MDSRPAEQYEALAEFLHGIGWKSPNDAQWTRLRDAIPEIARIIDEKPILWRCFHCDEAFTDEKSAALHFGRSLLDQAACLLDEGGLKALRDAEAELARYRDEDSYVDREIMGLKSSHATALVREEEKGYAKGLADGRGIAALLPIEAQALIEWHDSLPGSSIPIPRPNALMDADTKLHLIAKGAPR